MSTPLLQVDNLESYYGPVLAIRGVSLSVESGQIVEHSRVDNSRCWRSAVG